MKKYLTMILALVLGVAVANARSNKVYDVAQAPQGVRTALNTHFPKAKVSVIKFEHRKGNACEVVFTNGTEIEINNAGTIVEVDCGMQGEVPKTLVLQPIRDYVAKNFKGSKIIGWEKERNKYKIDLSNGMELEFDRSGRFLRIDD